MVWWLWMLLGLALLFIELATPGGFFALFFGVSAIVVGGVTALGLAGAAWVQWLLFSALSIVALFGLRGPLRARLNLNRPGHKVDAMVGESAVVTEEIPPAGVGKVELRGSSWTARSNGGVALAKGERCRVERVEGLTVWVRPE